MALRTLPKSPVLSTTQRALRYWRKNVESAIWFDAAREICVTIALDTKLRPIGFGLVSLGTVNETIIEPRDVFRPAIVLNSAAVIVMHNHPSSDPTPSPHDYAATERLCRGGELLNIVLVDHIIVGEDRKYFSFVASGKLILAKAKKQKHEKNSALTRPKRTHRR